MIGKKLCVKFKIAFLLAHLASLQGVWLTVAVTKGIVDLLGIIIYFKYNQKR